jgi:uncharacterized protein (DUF1015 family)
MKTAPLIWTTFSSRAIVSISWLNRSHSALNDIQFVLTKNNGVDAIFVCDGHHSLRKVNVHKELS